MRTLGGWALRMLVAVIVIAAAGYLFFDYVSLLWLRLALIGVPHGSIAVAAWDDRGQRLGSVEFFRTWRPFLIVRDRSGVLTWGFANGLGEPRIAVPPDEPISFDILWPVPGFGKVLLTADNQGHGYRLSAGSFTRIEIVPELARTRMLELERWIASRETHQPANDEIASQMREAKALIDGLGTIEGGASRQTTSEVALRLLCTAAEQEVLAEAKAHLGEKRRGGLAIKLIDASGSVIPQAKIQLMQTRIGYPLGINSDRIKELEHRFAGLGLGYTALAARDQATAQNLQALKSLGYTVSVRLSLPLTALTGAPLGATNTATGGLTPSEQHKLSLTAEQLRQADLFEIATLPYAFRSTRIKPEVFADAFMKIVQTTAALVHKAVPDAHLALDVADPIGAGMAAQAYGHFAYGGALYPGSLGDPFVMARRVSAGGSIDVIGLEFAYGCAHFDRKRQIRPALDLFRIAEEIARYQNLGKAVALTAVDAPAGGCHSAGWWHAQADQGIQADFLASLFTLGYADSKLMAVGWQGLEDSDSMVETGGLINAEGKQRLGLLRLASVLATWRGSGDVQTDAAGTAQFDGPAGTYRLTATVGKDQVSGEARVTQGGSEVVLMRLGVAAPATPTPEPTPEFEPQQIAPPETLPEQSEP